MLMLGKSREAALACTERCDLQSPARPFPRIAKLRVPWLGCRMKAEKPVSNSAPRTEHPGHVFEDNLRRLSFPGLTQLLCATHSPHLQAL